MKRVTQSIVKTLADTFLFLEVSQVNSFNTEVLSQNYNNSIRVLLSERGIRKLPESVIYTVSFRYTLQVSQASSVEDDYQALDLVDRIISCLLSRSSLFPAKNEEIETRPIGRSENGNFVNEIRYSFDHHLDSDCLVGMLNDAVEEDSFIPASLKLTFNNILTED